MPRLHNEQVHNGITTDAEDQQNISSNGHQTISSGEDNPQLHGSIVEFDSSTPPAIGVPNSYSLPLSWHRLSYSVGKKRILCGLTGTALPGRCLAILGSSGAGKTTFLNAICDRLASGGELKLSGRRQLGDC
ncbi:ATP-binding cassette protein subfamily G, member 1, putative, partial [Leishmania donovani]